jgi:ubiquinol-cytochrome c reductase iron-sulfur subunit
VSEHETHSETLGEPTRRDFLYLTTGMAGVVGAVSVAWPFIDQMRPDASTLALASIEVNVGALEPGMSLTVKWRGKPVFIRHRTEEEIKAARSVELGELRDPEADEARAQRPEWLITVGVCTHLGCIPLGQKPTDPKGDYGGWFCPCHGSHYDTSGRIRRGPAPQNLVVPDYLFASDAVVRIGEVGPAGGAAA